MEKLSLFIGDRKEIEAADVAAVCTRNKSARAFALGDALGDRDLPRLLRTLDEELWELKFDKQKSEIGLLYGLISKVRALILLKEMLREGWIKADGDYNRFKAQLERACPRRSCRRTSALQSAGAESVCVVQGIAAGAAIHAEPELVARRWNCCSSAISSSFRASSTRR